MTVMGMGIVFLSWGWVGMGTEIVLPAHLYFVYCLSQSETRLCKLAEKLYSVACVYDVA